jgi:ribosomal protein S18 acetylase RimI-like enzyme
MPDSNSWQTIDRNSDEGADPHSTSSGDPDSTSSGDPDCTSAGDSDGDPDSTKPTIVVRTTRRSDFAAIERISRRVYPTDPWTSVELSSQHERFPEGQLVAVDAGTQEVVGMVASLLIRWRDYDEQDSYARMTAYGSFRNHDPSGETLYGAEVMVDPSRRRQGIGAKLYAARRQLARRLGARRILAGARLPGYSRYADALSAEQYVEGVVSGELSDPTLSFQLQQGFRVVGVVSHYARGDRQSHGYAALIEWPCDRWVPSVERARPRPAAQRVRPKASQRPWIAGTLRRARAS